MAIQFGLPGDGVNAAMKMFLVASSMVALAMAAPASAGGRGGMGGGWQAPRPAMPAPSMPSRPNMPNGGWYPMPQPQPGGWHPQPGGWQQPKPMPGGWHPQPGKPGGWQPGKPGGWQPGKPGGWHPQPGPIGGNGCLGGCHPQGPKWGGHIGGRWWAGMRAPGGWGAYRHVRRGYTLPSYWIAPSFYIADFGSYGLPAPPQGYYWSRYYDDAVLVDPRGQVYDSVGGVRWDQGDAYADAAYDGNWSGYGDYVDGGYDGYPGYAPDSYPAGSGYDRRESNGVGGAIVGGVVGGVAGNVIAGRGDKLAGTLIGAGAGAIVGSAIDRSASRRRDYAPPPPPGYGPGPGYGPSAGYPAPGGVVVQGGGYGSSYSSSSYSSSTTTYGAGGGAYSATSVYPGGQQGPGMSRTVMADGTVVYASSRQAGDGYYANGYYYPGTTLTTVTVQPDCDEEVEEEVVDRSPPPQNWSYTKQRRYHYTK